MRPIFVASCVDERLRHQEGDAGAGRVERVGVRVAPVVLDVTFDATRGIFASAMARRHLEPGRRCPGR